MGWVERWRRRHARRDYRAMVAKWNADGGDECFRFDYPLTAGSFVLDLGGYQGQWAADLYARHRCRIAVFEPVARFAADIRARFAGNPDVAVYDLGLGGTSRTETLQLRGAGSSTHRRGGAAETIRIVDADAWLAEHDVAAVALMKINTEGGEFELLERLLDTGRITTIGDIQVQFHDVVRDSAARMEAIQARLRATHEPTYQYRFVWENWRRKADGPQRAIG
jgi:FkbM family methyltransferase